MRGELEGSRGGRVYVQARDDLGDRATPLSGTQLVPDSFETEIDGWQFKDGAKTAIRLEGEPYMPVGSQYVLPIAYFSNEGDPSLHAGWAPYSPNTIFAVQGGVLGKGDPLQVTSNMGAIRAAFAGKSAGAFAQELQRTKPDELGIKNPHDSPIDRFRAANKAERSTS